MKRINPYINFNGQAREAMNFYKGCFGGELTFMTVGESPMAANMPDQADTIMHSQLEFENGVLMATDMQGGDTTGSRIAIALDCSSEEEINRHFAILAEGGNTFCPLGPAFWGGLFGVTTDKFGITWMLTHNNQ